jgi:hypothetical protein
VDGIVSFVANANNILGIKENVEVSLPNVRHAYWIDVM